MANMLSACTCFDIDSASAQQLIHEVEFVIIGHPMKNVEFIDEIRNNWDRKEKGYEVVFEIDSVIKGELPFHKIILNQFSNGNCSRLFEFGEQYLIFGTRLTEFINRTPEEPNTQEGEIPPTFDEGPPPSVSQTKMFCYNNEQEEVDYWNVLANENVVIYTSQCSSFFINSKAAEYFLNP